MAAELRKQLVGPRVLTPLLSVTAERVCYSALAAFLSTFLLTRFGLVPAVGER